MASSSLRMEDISHPLRGRALSSVKKAGLMNRTPLARTGTTPSSSRSSTPLGSTPRGMWAVGLVTSASMRPTVFPSLARPIAVQTDTRVLPTPPLGLRTTQILRIPESILLIP